MKKSGKVVNGVSGIYFPYGSMGAYSIGDGNFMLVEPLIEEEGNLSVNFVKYNLDTSGEEYKFDRIEKE